MPIKVAEFNKLLSNLSDLTDLEREKLTYELQHVGGEEKVIQMIESRLKSQDCCPHCGSTGYHPQITYNDIVVRAVKRPLMH